MSDLTPTEDLICEVLAARHRLGEPFWPVDRRHRRALDSLTAKGLVSYQSGWTPKDLRAQLTDKGRAVYLKDDYVAPALDPMCRSFYIGPLSNEQRVDCERERHGANKKHRTVMTMYRRSGKATESTVKWTDDEAGGRASALYGPRLREIDARHTG